MTTKNEKKTITETLDPFDILSYFCPKIETFCNTLTKEKNNFASLTPFLISLNMSGRGLARLAIPNRQ